MPIIIGFDVPWPLHQTNAYTIRSKKKKKKTQVSWKFRVPKSGPLAQQGVVHIGRLGLDILQVLLRALCILLLQAHLDLGVTD